MPAPLRELQRQGVGTVTFRRSAPVRLLGRACAGASLERSWPVGSRAVIVPSGNRGMARWLPIAYWRELIPIAFDCWEPLWDRWEHALRHCHVRVAFFTARCAAEEMGRRIPELDARWLPEAVDPRPYDPGRPLAARGIDVLEMGRRFPRFNESARGPLRRAGATHLYPTDGKLFGTHGALCGALSDTRVLVCYPRCDTHPEQTGSVETLTLRYLEGIASGCVVAGRAPRELCDLFGYDPVVPIDPDRAGGQLLAVLDDLQSHAALVERNLRTLAKTATWSTRIAEMLGALGGLGYGLPARERQAVRRTRPVFA